MYHATSTQGLKPSASSIIATSTQGLQPSASNIRTASTPPTCLFLSSSETEIFSEGPGKYIQIQTWLRNCLEYVTLTSRNLRNKNPRQTTRNKQLARSFSQRRFHLHVAKKTSTTGRTQQDLTQTQLTYDLLGSCNPNISISRLCICRHGMELMFILDMP